MNRRGFTLIEFLIIVAIAGILTATLLPVVTKKVNAHKHGAQFPSPTGFVVDGAGVLSDATEKELADRATAIAKDAGPQIAVVTVQTVEPLDLESYTVKLAETWGIGNKEKDNGVLLFVTLKERQIRIEVGRGLEGALPDAKAGRIISDVITPPLKAGKFDDGMKAGFYAIVDAIKGEK